MARECPTHRKTTEVLVLQPAATRIGGVAEFYLQRGVLDAELLMKLISNLRQQRIVADCLRHDHVRGQRSFSSAHAPGRGGHAHQRRSANLTNIL